MRLAGVIWHSDYDFYDSAGCLLAQWRGVASPPSNPYAEKIGQGISVWPEIRELGMRKTAIVEAGFELPYFTSHDGVAGATTRVAGRELINFSSYNYLGLAGAAEVNRAAIEAVIHYGTISVGEQSSSKRGSRPLHAKLDRAIAQFLDCEAAVTLVSGHATNVTLIGHLFGPEDLILHDSLAHDCIVSGARLSGARRLIFPHNDVTALEQLLARERPTARRTLIAVEGVYSMDGDVVPLSTAIIDLKKRYDALIPLSMKRILLVLLGRQAGELASILASISMTSIFGWGHSPKPSLAVAATLQVLLN